MSITAGVRASSARRVYWHPDEVADGDEVAGFRVVHIPGHAPGQVALFRETDRLLLAADAIYTLDAETGQPASARAPHPLATGTPRWHASRFAGSCRSLLPACGSATPSRVLGQDVTEQLERAAEFE
jgi:hydroxyacylglutathione hydrolase